MKITDTEKRILQNLHLKGCTGKMGSLNKDQRGKILKGLQDKGLLDKNCRPTQKGIEVSAPFYVATNEDNYDEWEGVVIDKIEEFCEVSRSDAQGIVEAQPFYMQQCWAKGMTGEETARFIDARSVVK